MPLEHASKGIYSFLEAFMSERKTIQELKDKLEIAFWKKVLPVQIQTTYMKVRKQIILKI